MPGSSPPLPGLMLPALLCPRVPGRYRDPVALVLLEEFLYLPREPNINGVTTWNMIMII